MGANRWGLFHDIVSGSQSSHVKEVLGRDPWLWFPFAPQTLLLLPQLSAGLFISCPSHLCLGTLAPVLSPSLRGHLNLWATFWVSPAAWSASWTCQTVKNSLLHKPLGMRLVWDMTWWSPGYWLCNLFLSLSEALIITLSKSVLCFQGPPTDVYVYWLAVIPNQREKEVEVTVPNLTHNTICPGTILTLVSSSVSLLPVWVSLPFRMLHRINETVGFAVPQAGVWIPGHPLPSCLTVGMSFWASVFSSVSWG